MNDEEFIVYTDGSSLSNPGPGGYGVVIRYGNNKITLSEGYDYTTNNRMEIMACIVALQEIGPGRTVHIHTDSQLVIDAMTKYVYGWIKRDWKKADECRVKNKDLWQILHSLIRENKVKFVKVKAHVGIPDNEEADQLAKAGAYSKDKRIDQGYLDELKLPKETPNKKINYYWNKR